MIETSDLPTLNALLNGLSAVFLLIGFLLIRQKRWKAHRAVMWTAFAISVIFLMSYLTYHYNEGSRPYEGEGISRIIYFVILITHVVLAAAVPPLAIVSLWRGTQKQFKKHRKIAKYTLPIWMYVSVTGVLVYLMLYVI
jgi:putative membrane protein